MEGVLGVIDKLGLTIDAQARDLAEARGLIDRLNSRIVELEREKAENGAKSEVARDMVEHRA